MRGLRDPREGAHLAQCSLEILAEGEQESAIWDVGREGGKREWEKEGKDARRKDVERGRMRRWEDAEKEVGENAGEDEENVGRVE